MPGHRGHACALLIKWASQPVAMPGAGGGPRPLLSWSMQSDGGDMLNELKNKGQTSFKMVMWEKRSSEGLSEEVPLALRLEGAQCEGVRLCCGQEDPA